MSIPSTCGVSHVPYLDLAEMLIKGLLYLDLTKRSIRGLLYLDLVEMSIKGLSKGFSTSILLKC